jgi:threonine dehydrogenase-like Zn-dependent dehydrogenase
MGTGHHAAVAAEVGPGKTVAVVGHGAVGLCGVIAAKRLGAKQIILLGRHANRIALAREFGATDIVRERDEAVQRVRELTHGYGVQA